MSNDALLKNLLNNDAPDDKDPYSRYTHQIAIPLQDASELHSALHSIQTSLVRDCPRLIRACVMPALLRMPLLYVDGSSLENGNVLGGGDGNVDAILEQVVHKAIKEVAYGEMAEPILLPFRGLELQGEDNSVLYAVGGNVNDESGKKKQKDQLQNVEDEEDGVIIVNDWSAAINIPTETNGPSGWEILEKLVLNIQNELESKYGLKTCWPLDKPQGEEVELEYEDPLVAAIKRNQQKWRPRVPFVRLPNDFYQDLEGDLEKRKNDINDSGDDNDEDEPSRMDMGFDGISPLFWYEAWGEEDILEAPGVRMQSVAVYRRMVPGGGEAEASFYVPTSSGGSQPWKTGANAASVDDEKSGNSMELPVGDAKLRARERREMAKSLERLGEVEQREEREWEQGKARWMEELSDQMDGNGETELLSDEDSLAQFDVGMEMGEVTVEGDAAYSAPWSERDVYEQAEESILDGPNASEETVPSTDYARLINDAPKMPQPSDTKPQGELPSIEAPKMAQPSDTKPRRELPSIEDNPIFQRLRKGQAQVTSQGQNTALLLDGTPPTTDEPLPPYPSDAHFVGAWRVLSSPLDTENIDDAESKSSDNFILRVDGQVMGGPVLDAQYQHKAAGGEWNMFQAIRKSDNKSESEEESSLAPPAIQTRIRIRLLVPPEKDRALVMEGEVTRLAMWGAGDAASPSDDGWMMASGGMLDGMLQNIVDVQSQPEAEHGEGPGAENGEGLLHCGGEAWMEDAEGGANRRKLGSFSLLKLKAIKRENLTYTVDVSRPNAKVENEDE